MDLQFARTYNYYIFSKLTRASTMISILINIFHENKFELKKLGISIFRYKYFRYILYPIHVIVRYIILLIIVITFRLSILRLLLLNTG